MKFLIPSIIPVFVLAQNITEYTDQDYMFNSLLRRNNVVKSRRDRNKLLSWLVTYPPSSVSHLSNYGCYCMARQDSTDIRPNTGQAVDAVDKACKRAHHCYQCAELDNQCRHKNIRYTYNLIENPTFPGNKDLRDIECTNDPSTDYHFDKCGRAICECDRQFALDLKEAITDWNPKFHWNAGNFDVHSGCPNKKCVGNECNIDRSGPTECCGQSDGFRFPFHSNGGIRKCCGSKTYNSQLQNCCEGQVVSYGSC